MADPEDRATQAGAREPEGDLDPGVIDPGLDTEDDTVVLATQAAAPVATEIEPDAAAEPSPGTGRRGGRGGRGGRPGFLTRDLTEGSVPRNLWSISWPQSVESLLNASDQLLDLLWAGRLGATSIAGLGVGQTYIQVGMTGRMGFDMAMRAMVSRAVGARDLALAGHVALQAFTLSGVFGILMALIGVFLTEPLLRVVGVPESVVQAGADYMRVQFIGSSANAFRMMSATALQASGDVMTPMRSTMVVRVFHVILSPNLVFGWLFFPELGLVGAALANVIGQGIGAVINFRVLFGGGSRLHLTLKGYRPDFPLIWRLIKTGAPASITSAERSFANLFLLGIVSPYGATTLAAFSLTRRLEQQVMMAARGFGQGAGILVGQNLGAGKPERARKTLAWGVLIVFFINLAMAAVFMLFPEQLVRIFNSDREFVNTAVTWVRIASIGYVFLGVGQVYMQSYNTAGDTLVPMLVTLVSVWLIQQPLALILPGLGVGELGIAWAVVAAVFVRLLIYGPYYFSERWLRIRF